jgi:hypothetical protein
MSEANVIYGADFKHKVKPKSKKQRDLEELATKVFYEAIGVKQEESPKEPA